MHGGSKCCQGAATVADGIFRVGGHLGERFGMAVGLEQRVVAEAAVAAITGRKRARRLSAPSS
jgi:hypothetical protein